MRRRKIGSYSLSEREPKRPIISRTNVGVLRCGIERFVKDFLRGIVELDISADERGDVNICTYFFAYALRLAVAHSAPEDIIVLSMSNTEDELTIEITHSIPYNEVGERILSALSSAGFDAAITEDRLLLRTRYYPVPHMLNIYARAPEVIYLDLMDMFFH